jgi:hypothetical protein
VVNEDKSSDTLVDSDSRRLMNMVLRCIVQIRPSLFYSHAQFWKLCQLFWIIGSKFADVSKEGMELMVRIYDC